MECPSKCLKSSRCRKDCAGSGVHKCYRECDKRVNNKFGENMCGAIGCCEVGDMPCECITCDRECDKPISAACLDSQKAGVE